jgi:hypothetical protein
VGALSERKRVGQIGAGRMALPEKQEDPFGTCFSELFAAFYKCGFVHHYLLHPAGVIATAIVPKKRRMHRFSFIPAGVLY